MITLVMTTADIQEALREMQATTPRPEPITVALHPSRHRGGAEWIARRGPSGSPHGAPGRLLLWSFETSEAAGAAPSWLAARDEPGGFLIGLGLGCGRLAGQVRGFARGPSGALSPLQVQLVGPAMPRLTLPEPGREGAARPLLPAHWFSPQGLYSRAVGALGLPTFARLQSSRIALLGVGGNGSLMAAHLARLMGPDGELALIDPDQIQAHNLPAWAFPSGRAILGRPKAEVLAEALAAGPDPPRIEVVPRSALDWTAQEVLKRYPILICCVDNPAARYAAAYAACLYHRVLVDISTGVLLSARTESPSIKSGPPSRQESVRGLEKHPVPAVRLPQPLLQAGRRVMGADVRLIVPGRSDRAGGCLLCHGGVGGVEGALQELERPLSPRPADDRAGEFWGGRAGSLYMLNADAVSLGMRLLTAFLGGEGAGSQHWQTDVALAHPLQWHRVAPSRRPDCPLCARAGRADDAWGERLQALTEATKFG